MAKTATRPDFFINLPVKEDEADEKGVTDNEKFLYGMTQNSGWEVFTKKKDDLLKDMESFQEVAIANGTKEDEIGKNAIIISMVKGVINRLWATTEDAKEACGRK
jgi:hypothetical protein